MERSRYGSGRDYAKSSCSVNPAWPGEGLGPILDNFIPGQVGSKEIPVARKYPEQIEQFRAAQRTNRSFDYKKGKSAGAQFLGESLAKAGGMNLDRMLEQGLCIVGDPDSVIRQIRYQQELLGAGTMMVYAPFATMPLDMATKSMELFAREVLPNLRD